MSSLATVRRGYEDPPTFLIRNQGEPALALTVVMQEGWNGLELGKAPEAEARTISRSLPLGISLSKVTDQAVNITTAVDEFMLKFFVALGVVLIVSAEPRLACRDRCGGCRSPDLGGGLRDHAGHRAGVRPGHTRRPDPGARPSGRRRHHRHRDDGGENGGEHGPSPGSRYAWSHTAAPMLSGTLVTVVGLMPVGFARSSAGEYAGNIFWIVGFALIASWVVAVAFTPYLGVKLLPQIKPVQGGHDAIYTTPGYRCLRCVIAWSVRRKFLVAGAVVAVFLIAGMGMGAVKQQLFPTSDRPEVMVEVQMPEGSSIETTTAAVTKVEAWLKQQPEAKIVTSYIGEGAPRSFLQYRRSCPIPPSRRSSS